MTHNQIAAIVLDNSLLIGGLGLITGMVPGILLFLIERDKLKHARERVAMERETVGRLENLVTDLQNALIWFKERFSEITLPDSEDGVTDPPFGDPLIPHPGPIRPVALPSLSGAVPPLPAVSSGKYVAWMSPSTSDSPRYVLLTWESGGTSFRVRDYVGGTILYPQGIAVPHEANFQSIETSLTFGDIWQKAQCHMKVRGELEQKVSEFAWWSSRLSTLTEGHENGRRLAPTGAGESATRGVLLMLSSDQQPPPRTEVRWHADQSAKVGITYLATTRTLTDMVKDKSLVVLYGGARLFNQVLGYGVFLEFISTSTLEGRKILDEHPHYQQYGMPEEVLGLVKMRDFKELPAGSCLDIFNATIDSTGISNGRPLALINIPESAYRAQVYFKSLVQVTTS